MLKDIDPGDIEDVTERLLSLVSEQKDGDTIKRIKLKGGNHLFVIAIVEHESKVNFRAPFKMLLYIALILDIYEKDVNKEASKKSGKDIKITVTKSFKYPPILPVVFYDGTDEWTAELNFLNRTEMSEIFEKYIPKFEYELVSLKEYSFADLAEFGDLLSLFMMIDKIKSAETFSEIGKLPREYSERLSNMNVPPHLMELLVKVITVLLRKIDVPQDEVDEFLERIDERGVAEMLAIADYNVQETRRLAREEADRRAEEANRRAEEESRRADKSEIIIKSAIKSLLDQGNTTTEISSNMKISEQYIRGLMTEFV